MSPLAIALRRPCGRTSPAALMRLLRTADQATIPTSLVPSQPRLGHPNRRSKYTYGTPSPQSRGDRANCRLSLLAPRARPPRSSTSTGARSRRGARRDETRLFRRRRGGSQVTAVPRSQRAEECRDRSASSLTSQLSHIQSVGKRDDIAVPCSELAGSSGAGRRVHRARLPRDFRPFLNGQRRFWDAGKALQAWLFFVSTLLSGCELNRPQCSYRAIICTPTPRPQKSPTPADRCSRFCGRNSMPKPTVDDSTAPCSYRKSRPRRGFSRSTRLTVGRTHIHRRWGHWITFALALGIRPWAAVGLMGTPPESALAPSTSCGNNPFRTWCQTGALSSGCGSAACRRPGPCRRWAQSVRRQGPDN